MDIFILRFSFRFLVHSPASEESTAEWDHHWQVLLEFMKVLLLKAQPTSRDLEKEEFHNIRCPF